MDPVEEFTYGMTRQAAVAAFAGLTLPDYAAKSAADKATRNSDRANGDHQLDPQRHHC
jgi:hypothetical protein